MYKSQADACKCTQDCIYANFNPTQIKKTKNPDLKEELKKHGLRAKGTKTVLTTAIKDHYEFAHGIKVPF